MERRTYKQYGMMKFFAVILMLLFAFLFNACRKFEQASSDDPMTNFNALWKIVNDRYCYFDLKGINWDQVKTRYKGSIRANMYDDELFDVMSAMLNELKDGHVNLSAGFDVSRYWNWYLDYPQNFNYTLLERNYLKNDYALIAGIKTTSFERKSMKVGYFYYSSFMNEINPSALDYYLQKYSNANYTGVIIDIRDNSGGRIDLVDTLARRFVLSKTLVGYIKFKSGPGKNDFTEFIPRYLEPANFTYSKPIVLLTNRMVYSSGNDFASVMSALPNVIIIGDRTGGGGGEPVSSELPNGWRVRFSANPLFNIYKQHIESGIAPNYYVNMDSSDEAKGIDTILEEAIDYLIQ